jgi:hypothetical protein
MWWLGWPWKQRQASAAPRRWPARQELDAGVNAGRSDIATGLAHVQEVLCEQPAAFSTLLFHVDFVDAYERPFVEVFFQGDPDVCRNHPLYGETLLAQRPRLLPADREYPVEFRYMAGVDTPDACAFVDTIVNVLAEALREEWQALPCPALAHVEVLAGWIDFCAQPPAGRVLDFATGAMREVELPDD